MNTALTLSFLMYTGGGLYVTRVAWVREQSLGAKAVLATTVGTCTIGCLLSSLSILGVAWSSVYVLVPLAASTLLSNGLARRHTRSADRLSVGVSGMLAAGTLGLLAFGLFTGRATSVDYVYFWGTKAFRFALARGIDVAFLARPDHFLLHADYPPLLPVTDAAVSMVTTSRSWWLGLAGTFFFAVGCVVTVWSLCRERIGSRVAASYAALAGAVISYGLVLTSSGGNAEALLLFFECVALGLLTSFPRRREAEWLASVAFVGMALTKVEGSVLASLIVLAFGLWRESFGERLRRLIRLAMLPLGALSTWLAFAKTHLGLVWYGQPYGAFNLRFFLPTAIEYIRVASFGAGYLPWIVPLLLWALSGRRSSGVRPAPVGSAYAVFVLFCFLHGLADPVRWVHSVAARLLVPSVVALVFAAASSEPGPIETAVSA